jgi:transcriptional regulator with XRE-family HTH domain
VVPAEAGEKGPNVGDNLRILRHERGLSLAQLAERSGVSRAMLNQIEIGKSSPTIALGWKIANGLGVSFGALLGEAAPSDFVVLPAAQTATFFSNDKSLRSRALFPASDSRSAELYELLLEPGGEERAHSHAAGTREHIFVDRGQLVIETGGQRAELQAGDVLFFRADRPHRYHNPGKEPTRFFLVMRYPAEPRKRANASANANAS